MATQTHPMPAAWNARHPVIVPEPTSRPAFDGRYERWRNRAKRRCLDAIFGSDRLSSSLVLDVGSDAGFFVDWYQARGAKVEGLDASAVRVDRLAERFPDARFTRRSVDAMAFAPLGTFHIVNAWDELRRFTDDAAFARALTNLAGCCDEGSLLLVSDRLGAAEDRLSEDGTKNRSLATYDQILSGLGFESVRTLPLYQRLNCWRPEWKAWNNRVAPLMYALDRFARELPQDNLSVGVWRYAVSREATIEPPGEMWLLAS